jgi:predicted outer membrane protein
MTNYSDLRATVVLAACIALAVLTGCGSDDDASTTPTPAPTKPTQSLVCPMDAGDAKSFDASTLVGKSVADAKTEAAKYGCTVRTVELDGKPMAATMDFNQSRINVSVEDNEVTAVQNIG